MPRYELVEGNSSKFWEIERNGSQNQITFGRIGTAGQSQNKDFPSEAAAQSAYEKLIKEKVGKGYQLVTSNVPTKSAVMAAAVAAVPTPVAAGTAPPVRVVEASAPVQREWSAAFLGRVLPGRSVLARAPEKSDLGSCLDVLKGMVGPLKAPIQAGLSQCDPGYQEPARLLLSRADSTCESMLASIHPDPEVEGAVAAGLGAPDMLFPFWLEARGALFALKAALASAWHEGKTDGGKPIPGAWWLVRRSTPILRVSLGLWERLRASLSICPEDEYEQALEAAREAWDGLEDVDRLPLAFTFPGETGWAEELQPRLPTSGYCSVRRVFHDGGMCLLACLRDGEAARKLMSLPNSYQCFAYLASSVYLLGEQSVPLLIELLGRKDSLNAEMSREILGMLSQFESPEAARFCLAHLADRSLKKPAQAYFTDHPQRVQKFQQWFLEAAPSSPERVLYESVARAHPELGLSSTLAPQSRKESAPASAEEVPAVLASPPWLGAPPAAMKPLAKVETPAFEERIHGQRAFQAPGPQKKYHLWDFLVLGAHLFRQRFPDFGVPFDHTLRWDACAIENWSDRQEFHQWEAHYQDWWGEEDDCDLSPAIEERSAKLELHPLPLTLPLARLSDLLCLASWCDARAMLLLRVGAREGLQQRQTGLGFVEGPGGVDLVGEYSPYENRLWQALEQLDDHYLPQLQELPEGTTLDLMTGNCRWKGQILGGALDLQWASCPGQPDLLLQALSLVEECRQRSPLVASASEAEAVLAQPMDVKASYQGGRLTPLTCAEKIFRRMRAATAQDEVSLTYFVSGERFYLEDEEECLAVWNSLPSRIWSLSGADLHLSKMLQRFGLAALPGFLQLLGREPATLLPVLEQVESPRLAAQVAELWARLKKERARCQRFLLRFPQAALLGVIPVAVGGSGKVREAAQGALRWLNLRIPEQSQEVIARFSPEVQKAVEGILSTDPLIADPKKLPRMPAFWRPAEFPPICLRSSGNALPAPALENLGVLLAVSTAEMPHPGLDSVKAACTPESLCEFSWALYSAWLNEGANPKEDWAFLALGHLGGDLAARRLTPLLRAWPGEGNHARAVRGLDVLALVGSDTALMYLNGIAQKVKFKGLQDKAREKMDGIAEARGLSADQLADCLVPDLGLEADGSRTLQCGSRTFRVGFDERLKPYLIEGQTRLSDLPKLKGGEEAAALWKALKKDASAIATLQIDRLEKAMASERRWSAQSFQTLFLEHPLVIHLVRRLIWAAYDGSRLVGTFRVAEDNTLADERDQPWRLDPALQVGLVHPVELSESARAAWTSVLADYSILQPFPQMGREFYQITEAERSSQKVTRFASSPVSFGLFLALEARGWRRETWGEGAICAMCRDWTPEWEATIVLDPGIPLYNPAEGGDQEVQEARGSGTLDQLSPVAFSELLRDVRSVSQQTP